MLEKLGLIKTDQSALAKALQLIQVDTRIPREHELQVLRGAGSGRRLFPDIDPVGHERDPFEECLDVVRHRSPRP
jgi:hypothetical protein